MLDSPSEHGSALSPARALEVSLRAGLQAPEDRPVLLVAGATGALGSEMLRRLLGGGRYSLTRVLVKEAITVGLPRVKMQQVPSGPLSDWPPCLPLAHTAVVMFEPPRLYYDRERALWTPEPTDLFALATWLKRSGVQTLVVVVPHAEGRLPQALAHGLANLDEHAIASFDFERVLLVRAAAKPVPLAHASAPARLAAWMLSSLKYMIPAAQQPLRASKLAAFVEAALQVLPAGTHVAAPELLWQAAQARDVHAVVRAWLNTKLSSGS